MSRYVSVISINLNVNTIYTQLHQHNLCYSTSMKFLYAIYIILNLTLNISFHTVMYIVYIVILYQQNYVMSYSISVITLS